MKYITLILLFFYYGVYCQQKTDKKNCNNTVYKTAYDYKNNIGTVGTDINWGTHITWGGADKVLKLKLKDSTQRFLAGTVFAFLDTSCILYRYYNEDFFVTTLNKDIGFPLYKHLVKGYSKSGVYANTNYYFSKNIYSKIVHLNKKNLLIEFKNDTNFINEINKIKNIDKLLKIDTNTKHYKLVDLYLKNHP